MALSRICLDTSAYSAFRGGGPDVIALVDAADWIGVPTVVLGELWIGFLGGNRLQYNASRLQEFLDDPAVEQLLVDFDVARIFAEITIALRRSGKPVPINDVWVAACAARHGATVVTYDQHFSRIDRVGSLILPTSENA